MAITGQNIVDRAWTILNDAGASPGVRWPAPEELLWVNSAQRVVCTYVPQAYVKRAAVTPSTDARQSASGLGLTDVVQFIEVPRNLNADNTTGPAISVVNRKDLDDADPEWTARSGARVRHVAMDSRDPLAFYLTPRITTGTGKIEVVYHATPEDLPSLADDLDIGDIYEPPMVQLVVAYSYMKNSSFSKSVERAVMHFQAAFDLLGVKDSNLVRMATKRAMEQPPTGGVTK